MPIRPSLLPRVALVLITGALSACAATSTPGTTSPTPTPAPTPAPALSATLSADTGIVATRSWPDGTPSAVRLVRLRSGNLTATRSSRPVAEHTVTIPFLVRSGPPRIEMSVTGESGEAHTIPVLIDTGNSGYFDFTHADSELVRPWAWPEAEGMGHTVGVVMGRKSPVTLRSARIGTQEILDIPASVPHEPASAGGSRLSYLGLGLLAAWGRVEFDWREASLVLSPRGTNATNDKGDQDAATTWIQGSWWHMIDRIPEDDNHPYLVIPAAINGTKVDFMVDTGASIYLGLPMSLATREPWASVLEADSDTKVFNMSGTRDAPTWKFTGTLELGDRQFTDLRVVGFDDSSMPPGSRPMPPIIGLGVLGYFPSITLDLERARFGFESK